MRWLLQLTLMAVLLLTVMAHAETIVTCRATSSTMSIAVYNVTWYNVSDVLGLCDVSLSNGTLYLLCTNCPQYYPVAVVSDGLSYAVDGGFCEALASAPLNQTMSEIENWSTQLAMNVTSPGYIGYLLGRVPGGAGTLALMVDVFAFMATRSPAVLAAAVLLTGPLLPGWLATPLVALSVGWLLYRAWMQRG